MVFTLTLICQLNWSQIYCNWLHCLLCFCFVFVSFVNCSVRHTLSLVTETLFIAFFYHYFFFAFDSWDCFWQKKVLSLLSIKRTIYYYQFHCLLLFSYSLVLFVLICELVCEKQEIKTVVLSLLSIEMTIPKFPSKRRLMFLFPIDNTYKSTLVDLFYAFLFLFVACIRLFYSYDTNDIHYINSLIQYS